MKWIIVYFKRYMDFSGRSTKEEYWYPIIFHVSIYLILITTYIILFSFFFTSSLVYGSAFGSVISFLLVLIFIISLLYFLLIFIPLLSVSIRRLHDIGYSGWYLLISFIPFLGQIFLIFLFLKDSERGKNKWGSYSKKKIFK